MMCSGDYLLPIPTNLAEKYTLCGCIQGREVKVPEPSSPRPFHVVHPELQLNRS